MAVSPRTYSLPRQERRRLAGCVWSSSETGSLSVQFSRWSLSAPGWSCRTHRYPAAEPLRQHPVDARPKNGVSGRRLWGYGEHTSRNLQRCNIVTKAQIDCPECRDRAVLSSLAAGATRQEIATGLFMSESAVAFRIRVMCAQLRVRTSIALVARAYSLGLLLPHQWPPAAAPHRCTTDYG